MCYGHTTLGRVVLIMISLRKKMRQFARAQDGLVAVEWVALTAGLVVASVGTSYIVVSNTAQEATTVGTGITRNVDSTFGTSAVSFASKFSALAGANTSSSSPQGGAPSPGQGDGGTTTVGSSASK